jgi:hypothetical protein
VNMSDDVSYEAIEYVRGPSRWVSFINVVGIKGLNIRHWNPMGLTK